MNYVNLNKPSDYPLTTEWVEVPEKNYLQYTIPRTTEPFFAWDCCGVTISYIYGVMLLAVEGANTIKDLLIRKLRHEVY